MPIKTGAQRIKSLADMQKYAIEVTTQIKDRQIICLVGGMGAGKTQWVKFFVDALGGQNSSSPTYAFHHQYDTSRGVVDHLDFHRLENDDDLESIGFWDLFARDKGIVIIEWADRLKDNLLPANWSKILISIHVQGDERRIKADWT